ncbi:MAG: phosphate ABC transporter substrate-binding protein PstS [Hydrogenophaga sp.]|jgi:phosphate transport system substrate-binding protein|uniref:phosphate ABC transporter substrate-binding protein PstS n=1 Tax=Hydrogenophaga sp. TaxID=1904254 RepID=UPI00272735B6|nr:phosphate ABC transporter substrate-binding protein PstS [Hydrogenophaga sp.]MDO9481996.1 phosphate ABC transporter substrate-binding protein PstS [Hydrogenophaga sp.]MDP1895311.1 phosphate ABC transporter substrate-binding protein PstS [Hydrogenophaga sp.]MDP2095566.1 phosphate ABC transporter substrate-binding protein PstS [Hydrogenophaga sp.]MDP2222686.1 phosphate ABC transporter substrate-binding protein PstS [Hydrogenophaga sp.]MDP3344686.1 phosphate ABC transporter substrate-binding p
MNTKRTLLKTVAAAAFATMAMGSALAADITGAGATFPFPIYAKWAEAYKQATGTGLNYQSIGSSGGIRQIRAKTVAFGASDAPVKGEDLDRDGMVQFPAIIGGTVPVFNLDGFGKGELRVSGPVLAEMFLGKISKWNDPKLAALNPGKKLPDQTITIVHRADGSGTTFNWTDYLATVSKEWLDTVGRGAAVKWPAPTSVGGKGNEGVAANVTRTKGALGYVEYAYAKKNNISVMALQNKDGNFVMPGDETFSAAAAGADWFSVPGMGLSIVNQPGANAYPVTTASFILMYKEPADKAQSVEVLKFFDWAFKNGKQMASDLDYVALPDVLTKQIRERVWTQINTK